MKTKWMCMIPVVALALNLSACGNGQEYRNSSENGTMEMETQSQEDCASENTGNKSNNINMICRITILIK